MHRRSAATLAFLLLALTPEEAFSQSIKSTVSPAAASNIIGCTSGCGIYSLYVTSGATAGYLLTFDRTTMPADGAVTPRECIVIQPNSTVSVDYGQTKDVYSTGMVAAFSTTGCFTLTASATAFFKVRKG